MLPVEPKMATFLAERVMRVTGTVRWAKAAL
jgi:hypothetical protein